LKIAGEEGHEVVDSVTGVRGKGGTSLNEAARQFGLELNDFTQWGYRRGTQPGFLRTGAGRIFGQYGMWPLSYFDFLTNMGKKALDPEYRVQALKAGAWWAAMNATAYESFASIGADTGKWWFFSPSAPIPTGSPHWQFVQALGKSMENNEEGRAARRRALEYPLNFIPGSTEVEGILRAYNRGEDFSGPGFIRALGMRPLPEIEKERDWEEWVQYQMGYKEPRMR
jgi:hypothetical protein